MVGEKEVVSTFQIQAKPDDGIFNYTAVSKVSRLTMLRLLPAFMSGAISGKKHVRMGEFKKLEIESDRPLYIHSDGEIIVGWGMDVRTFGTEILPGSLEIVV